MRAARLFAAVLLLAGVLNDPQAARSDELSEQLRQIKEGYRANQAAFPHGRVKVKFTRYCAASEEDALAGKMLARPKSAVCTIVFRDDRIAASTPDLYVDNETNNEFPIWDVPTANVVRKSDGAIEHDPDMHHVVVHATSGERAKVRIHPFNLAKETEGLDLISSFKYQESNPGRVQVSVGEMVTRDDRAYLPVEFRGARHRTYTVYYVDPARGYLPFITERVVEESDHVQAKMQIVDWHQTGSAFFPTRAIEFVKFERGPDRYLRVSEMKVLNYDLDFVPTDADLAIELDTGLSYVADKDPGIPVKLFKRKDHGDTVRVAVDDVAAIAKQLAAAVKGREAKEKKPSSIVPSIEETNRTLYIMLGFAAVVILLVIAYFALSRRPRQAAAARVR